MAGRWILYGANGYTGELIAEEAAARGEKPILAGRRSAAVIPVAERLGLDHRIFALDDPAEVARELDDVDAILLCAGPFSATSAPVVSACLETGTHYLDITGEIAVFEDCHRRSGEAEKAGCALMPGVGFDVVPSDCLAASLAAELPVAETLELAFSGVGAPSKGTATTMVEGMPQGGAIRKDGQIVGVPLAWKTKTISFRDKARSAVSIPWGDVSTAYYSTGIPNITVYMAAPPKMIAGMKIARPFRKLLAARPVQSFLKSQVQKRVEGPTAEQRRTGKSQLWGRVTGGGDEVTGTLVTPESYQITVKTALDATLRAVAGEVAAGARTPSMAFGADYITRFDGCDLVIDG